MQRIVSGLLMALGLFNMMLGQRLSTYTWPVDSGQAVLSDKYEVYVREGNNPEVALQVLMSNAIHEGDFRSAELAGRTFSFVQVSYNSLGSSGLTFRVVKKYGSDANGVELSPKSYGLAVNSVSGKEITFEVPSNNRYISVNFLAADNDVALPNFMASKGIKWIRHMLCIFVDPIEPTPPAGNGVISFSTEVEPNVLQNAQTIVFPAGYHNLNDYAKGGIIDGDGVLTLQDEQDLYFEGGAFVEGIIDRDNFNDDNQRIYGRGILTGRQYLWRNHPQHAGREYGEILRMGSGEIEGIMLMESPNHGLVGRNVQIKNFKYLGWHANNDGIRIGSGSEVENSFLRCVDDHFYNFDIYVHDCVLWAGHNGAIMTYGWGGTAGSNTYNSGSSFMEDVDIINPEWGGLGNNNGLIMSQTGLDYAPHGYGGATTTIFRRIRMEGIIPGLTNLKPRTGGSDANLAVPVPANEVGYLGDLILEDIEVEAQFEKGRIRGLENASTTGTATYYVQNVSFDRVTIAGNCLNEQNKNQFFDIEASTTKDIVFVNCSATKVEEKSLQPSFDLFPNPCKHAFKLSLSGDWGKEVFLQITDMQGKSFYEAKLTGSYHTADLSSVSRGMYIVKVWDMYGRAIFKKLSKHE